MNNIVMTRAQWFLHLLAMMIQSSLGMALSAACLWSYKEKMILVVGDSNAQFFYYFSLGSMIVSAVFFIKSFIQISLKCSEISLEGDENTRRRLTGGNQQRRVYGAFGYYSIV